MSKQKSHQQSTHKFSIDKTGIYSITIQASCKSGKLLGIFGGQDLRIEIDNRKFREIPAKGRPQYFNIPSGWNGTQLKGLSKTTVFILKLNKGEHNIKFISKKGAKIQSEPQIKAIKNKKVILKNIQAQDGNRRPWITLALIDLPLSILDISATCEKRFRDSDDLKLIIDNKIQKNKKSKIWGKNWYWQGRQLKGETKDVRFYPKLTQGIHYIELWADRMPRLEKVELNLGTVEIIEDEKLIGKIALYKDIEEVDFVNIRSAPERPELKGLNDNKIARLKDGEKIEILEKEVKKEYVQNKSDIWHKIRYKNKEEVKGLIKCVEGNRKKKDWRYIITGFIFVGLIFLVPLFYLNILNHSKQSISNGEILGVNSGLIKENRFKFYNPYPEINTVSLIGYSQEPFIWQTNLIIKYKDKIIKKYYPGFLENAYLFDLNFSGYPELFLIHREGKQILTSILSYNNKNNVLEPVKFINKDGTEGFNLCCSYIVYKPLLNGVQYHLAMRIFDYGDSFKRINEYEVVYEYDFLNNIFYEKEKKQILP